MKRIARSALALFVILAAQLAVAAAPDRKLSADLSGANLSNRADAFPPLPTTAHGRYRSSVVRLGENYVTTISIKLKA